MEDAVIWTEYGCPIDIRTSIPAREYQAHLAILRGRAEKLREENQKLKRQLRS
jgi:hypothetical protein